MFLRLQPLLYSLLFLAGLEMVVLRPDFTVYLMIVLVILSALAVLIRTKRWMSVILPVTLSFFSIAVLYFVTIPLEKQLFILVSSIFYYLLFLGTIRLLGYAKDKTAEGMLMASSFASLLFAYFSIYGFYLNFLVSVQYLMLAFFIVTFLVSYQYFKIIEGDKEKKTIFYSFILAFIMSELVWPLNFWPFGYLTTGVVALILYYVIWEITRSHFLDQLNRKKVVFNMVLFSFLIVMVLVSSKWMPNF